VQVVVAFNRLKLAFGVEQSWTSKAATDALLQLLRIPLRGVSWEKNDARGFFNSLSTDWWLSNAGWVGNLGDTFALALPIPTQAEMERVVADAVTDLFIADTKIKPGKSGLGPWDKYTSEAWLLAVVAQARLKAGADVVTWQGQFRDNCHRLHTTLEILRDAVELRFVDSNPAYFTPEDPVALAFVA